MPPIPIRAPAWPCPKRVPGFNATVVGADYMGNVTHVPGTDRVYLASPGFPSWNQILSFLQQMSQLREAAGSAA